LRDVRDDPILSLAFANLRRDRRRTLLTLLPGAAALLALLLLGSINEALQRNLSDNFQDRLVGSLQIHGRGFFLHPRLDNAIDDTPRVISILQQQEVTRWTPRIETFALAAGPHASNGLMLIAMDPDRERGVTTLAQRIAEGRFLRTTDGPVCLLGRGAARNLGVTVGDTIDLITYDRFGAPVGDRLEVTGILEGGGFGIDRQIIFVPLGHAQTLLEMPDRVTDLVLRLPASRLDKGRSGAWAGARPAALRGAALGPHVSGAV